MFLKEADAQALSKKILGYSKADSCIVTLSGGEERHVRFAQNMATTNGAPSSLSVGVESHFGKRSGSASSTDLSDDALAALVAASEKTAKLAPENPEFMPPIGPQKYLAGTGYSAATETTTPAQIAASILPVLQQAQARNLQASGFLDLATGFSSFANSNGLFVYDKQSSVLHTVTARTRMARAPVGPARRIPISPRWTSPGWARSRSTRPCVPASR